MELLFSEATNSRCSKVDPGLLQYQRWSCSWQYLRLLTIATKSSIIDAVRVSPRSTSEILFGCKSFLFIEIFYFCFSRFGQKRMGETKKYILASKKRAQRKECIRYWHCIFEECKAKNGGTEFSIMDGAFYQTKAVKGNINFNQKVWKRRASIWRHFGARRKYRFVSGKWWF